MKRFSAPLLITLYEKRRWKLNYNFFFIYIFIYFYNYNCRICWNCRRKKKKQAGQNQEVDDPSSTNDVSPHHVIYERVEEDGGYLTYPSRSSIYDQLERNEKMSEPSF